ncbi:hypothetical protein [Flavilitoribacter nigricans]|uniref:DUF481 domain-containing protein n=1 Tax=Flavilitoribacter nigricans (strain ATCC 23147 / DSM 23189 / NBRC 102662 / NCIMB 1420 / SS-2) TaxID=1122177 RepID=A0A2D0N5Y9_FLAN2|nr:hypothetical protein [Flavilitoribacter nigricans]PHN03942.1 hypothetical protein CRP01_24025 [Flavilitoribacter nigricans DSM 23189 = NBRC 102662]
MNWQSRSLFLFFLSFLFIVPAQAQMSEDIDRLNVFVDCSACDMSYLKQEINYVNHAVDPFVAQVHIFIANQGLNSGGTLYKINFIGKGKMDGNNLNMDLETDPTATSVEINQALKRTIEMGLVAFLAHTPMGDQIELKIKSDAPVAKRPEPVSGPLDNWIFELSANAAWNNESSQSVINTSYALDADYVTPEMRIRMRPYYSYRQQKVQNNGEDIISIRRRSYMTSSVVKSINDHWSYGFFHSLNNSTYSNIKLANWIAPALEYNIFPYSEVPFKEFTIAYRVGWLSQKYYEETIYFKLAEEVLSQVLNVNLRLRQPWGYVNTSLRGSNFLNDWSKNRMTFDSRLSVRVIKGFSVNLSGGFEVINDQISLPKGEASIEEILLGQRQLATNFETNLRFGLSYTFGDLYNNVVNTRL